MPKWPWKCIGNIKPRKVLLLAVSIFAVCKISHSLHSLKRLKKSLQSCFTPLTLFWLYQPRISNGNMRTNIKYVIPIFSASNICTYLVFVCLCILLYVWNFINAESMARKTQLHRIYFLTVSLLLSGPWNSFVVIFNPNSICSNCLVCYQGPSIINISMFLPLFDKLNTLVSQYFADQLSTPKC